MRICFLTLLSAAIPVFASTGLAQGSFLDRYPELASIVITEDTDGDGIKDSILGIPNAAGGVGIVKILDGDTGTVTQQMDSAMLWGMSSVCVAELDGNPKIVVGIPFATVDNGGQPLVAGQVCVIDVNDTSNVTVIDGSVQDGLFGAKVSANGSTVVIGAPGEHAGLGAVHGLFLETMDFTPLAQGANGFQVGWNVHRPGNYDTDASDQEFPATLVDPNGETILRFFGMDGDLPYDFTLRDTQPGGRGPTIECLDRDLNQDGVSEWAVGYTSWSGAGVTSAGIVDIVDGGTGATLNMLPGVNPSEGIGVSLGAGQLTAGPTNAAEDMTQESTRTIVVAGGLGSSALEGSVRAWDAVTGELVFSRSGVFPREVFGISIATGDFNHDGNDELVIARPGGREGTLVVSMADLAFTSDRSEISAIDGGAVQYSLTEPAMPSATYYFVMSASGTTPGFPFLGQHVWLNLDALSVLWGPQLFPGQVGTLGSDGTASAFMNLPGGLLRPGVTINLNVGAAAFDGVRFKTYPPHRLRLVQ